MRLALGAAALAVWSATLAASAPIVLAGDGLTEETWSRVERGTWLVEHYSPYCSHCKAFAPKWKELVDQYSSSASSHNFHFAQVDCALNGDLCHAHSVKYYPSIFLYVDGKFQEEYEEQRTIEELGKYVEAHYPAEEVPPQDKEMKEEGQAARKAQEADAVGGVEDTEEEEQVGMGEGKLALAPGRPVKGAEKARLPKEDGMKEGKPRLPILHVAEEDEQTEGSSDGSMAEDEPYEALLADASLKMLPPTPPASSSPSPSGPTSTQTPPSQPTKTSQADVALAPDPLGTKYFVPAFVAQVPQGGEREKKRSEEGGSNVTEAWEKERGKPDGKLKLLKPEEVERLKDADAMPSFVKYYAPWCGHCKKLAPHWIDLASALSDIVHVYEVDCDAAENKGVCRRENVRAYPTLIFYNRGASVEYHGKRNLNSMKEWALKTVETTTIKPLANEYELKQAVSADDVIVLFLHNAEAPQDDANLARAAAKSVMGSTPFYASSSPDLFTLFSVSTSSPPTFLVFKDHSLAPASSFSLPPASFSRNQRGRKTIQWLRSAKLPTVSELNGGTYNDLMPSDGGDEPPPLVGLAVLSRKGLGSDAAFENAKGSFERLARGWTERSRTGTRAKGRDVNWAWVDGDRWSGWARSMYDVKAGAQDGPVLLVADPKELVYWKTTPAGEPLELGTSAVYDLIENGIYTGTARSKSSQNMVERGMKSIIRTFSYLYATATAHPFLAFILIVGSWLGFWFALKRLVGPIPSAGPARSSGYAKVD
ncbi:hypothetical protein JCM21900_004954 [Sporobolomyces salmonicolor]